MNKQEAIKTLHELWRETNDPWYEEVYSMAIKALNEQAKEGEWIDKGEYAECSLCGAHSGTQYDGVEPIPLKTKYCPDCGKKMKGADNE